MKTKNVVKRILAMMMVMALMLTTSMTAFAATGSRTYKAASKMTITLNPGQRGNSNTVTIRVSDLPEDAIITKLTVNTGSMTYSGGAIVCNRHRSKWLRRQKSMKKSIVTKEKRFIFYREF